MEFGPSYRFPLVKFHCELSVTITYVDYSKYILSNFVGKYFFLSFCTVQSKYSVTVFSV